MFLYSQNRIRCLFARIVSAGVLISSALFITEVAASNLITGTISNGGSPMSGVVVYAPGADCTLSSSAGTYSCTVPAGWTGNLAPRFPGYAFMVQNDPYGAAAKTIESLATNLADVNFSGASVSGLRSELAIYRTAVNRYMIDYDGNRSPDANVVFGATGDIPLVGDIDGDGISDLILYRNGIWFVSTNRSNSADQIYYFGGMSGDIPLLADFDGDGLADLGIFRNGVWYVSTQRNGQADKIYYFGGSPGDIPLAADMDGDGLADLVIFRSGRWFVDTTRTGTATSNFVFGGVAGEIPVILDYDGDGKMDAAVVRNGMWFVSTTLDGVLSAVFGYGTTGDSPLAGTFNTASSLFVRSGSSCTTACSQTNPYGSIQTAWQKSQTGDIIRIAPGTYVENLILSYPGNQYLPNQFGKNHIKFLGAGRKAVIVQPTSGDALYIQGSSGNHFRKMAFVAGATNGRGVVMTGGPGQASALPTFPGAHAEFTSVAFGPSDKHNLLLTGTSWVAAIDSVADRSKTAHGISLWDSPFALLNGVSSSENGWGIAAIPLPDAGKGLELLRNSDARVQKSRFQNNLTFGVIAINASNLVLDSSTVSGSGYAGIELCGATAPDTTRSKISRNWISSNGYQKPAGFANGFNGLEVYTTCSGIHEISANNFISNSYNGAFISSSTATVSGNAFKNNFIGLGLYVNDAAYLGEPASAQDTNVTVTANTFDANRADGIYAERFVNTGSPKKLIAHIGGAQSGGLNNSFLNHVVQSGIGFAHAISCKNLLASDFACPSAENIFSGNTDNIESTCPSSCRQ